MKETGTFIIVQQHPKMLACAPRGASGSTASGPGSGARCRDRARGAALVGAERGRGVGPRWRAFPLQAALLSRPGQLPRARQGGQGLSRGQRGLGGQSGWLLGWSKLDRPLQRRGLPQAGQASGLHGTAPRAG